MIRTKNLKKSYKSIQVLKGVDLNIAKSEIVSIVGASGAGKTTLLQILGTLDAPSNDNCQLLIDNTDILKLKQNELSKFRNTNIGFIFQFHQLLPEFTALENVCIPGYIKKRGKNEIESRAKELLSYLGLDKKLHNKPNELSGGEQQRVAVARALINDPKVIFADEPSGNLDSVSADNLYKLFFDIRSKYNTTFIIVTHNEKLANLADRKIEITDGIINK
ncbi:MAG: ABC transporter ATP-binding protein [Flavobacteriales bacterium]|jgi:lipoprotein-releasing system ATP-binding protein|tara:strand:+ start:59125 stop:59784 length:660 start_codon:yes stop_codon:yes gene_type:complete